MAPRKRGPPPPGEPRRLTWQEAESVGAPRSWYVRVGADGCVTLLRRYRGALWVVDLRRPVREKFANRLADYWSSTRRPVVLSAAQAGSLRRGIESILGVDVTQHAAAKESLAQALAWLT